MIIPSTVSLTTVFSWHWRYQSLHVFRLGEIGSGLWKLSRVTGRWLERAQYQKITYIWFQLRPKQKLSKIWLKPLSAPNSTQGTRNTPGNINNPNYIKNNAWVTVNNDFGVKSEAICQLLANRIKSHPKSLFTVTNVSFYLLHAIWCHEHTISLKQLSVADFAIVAKAGVFFWLSIVTSPQMICDVTRIWDTGIVTSYSLIVLARANWRKGDSSHECRYLTTGIHGLACKKGKYFMRQNSRETKMSAQRSKLT